MHMDRVIPESEQRRRKAKRVAGTLIALAALGALAAATWAVKAAFALPLAARAADAGFFAIVAVLILVTWGLGPEQATLLRSRLASMTQRS